MKPLKLSKYLVLFLIFTCPLYAEPLTQRVGITATYWNELAIKPGVTVGADWEFMDDRGHGVGVTFPNMLFFVFPNNYFSFSLYSTVGYRFVHPKNGFYTSLSMGLGLNVQWKTVPVYNIKGEIIEDTGLHRGISTAQWDVGYDFETVLKVPLRLFFSMGWNGIFPNNLDINSHFMMQIGVNVKLIDLRKNK